MYRSDSNTFNAAYVESVRTLRAMLVILLRPYTNGTKVFGIFCGPLAGWGRNINCDPLPPGSRYGLAVFLFRTFSEKSPDS